MRIFIASSRPTPRDTAIQKGLLFLRSGQLEAVLPGYPPPEEGIHAVYPHSRNLSVKVRVFVDFLTAHFGAEPYWDAGLAALVAPPAAVKGG